MSVLWSSWQTTYKAPMSVSLASKTLISTLNLHKYHLFISSHHQPESSQFLRPYYQEFSIALITLLKEATKPRSITRETSWVPWLAQWPWQNKSLEPHKLFPNRPIHNFTLYLQRPLPNYTCSKKIPPGPDNINPTISRRHSFLINQIPNLVVSICSSLSIVSLCSW